MEGRTFSLGRAIGAAVLGSVLWCAAAPLAAQDMAAPPALQAKILKKVFSFDDRLAGAKIQVLVAHATAGGATEEVVAALESVGFDVITSSTADLASKASGASVVYVMPGAGSVKATTIANSLLSVSGDPSLAESGEVAVAIGVEGGKPTIIVHMGELSAEGHTLGAGVLKLARRIE